MNTGLMKIIKNLIFRIGFLYSKLQFLIMTIAILGILDFFVYYELAVSMMTLLAPEIAPVILLIFAWLIYKGIKKYIQDTRDTRNKKYSFLI
ncbi:hypothetical protein H8B09_11365 [Paenibacillus sp. PR3]|uniref:Uncharacterized protein n=1 Tax=Paenibacillus terricola TaxID=2763503 RepID=A0ABR8MYU2_9BACL|nr:hypothetical protein [Paenibacillus terricola]MBD3919354.1 hypothetical protein [Paenibacillus terricola]